MEIFSYFNSIRFICSHINSSSAVQHSWKHRMSRQQRKKMRTFENTTIAVPIFSLSRSAHHSRSISSSRKIFLSFLEIERFQLFCTLVSLGLRWFLILFVFLYFSRFNFLFSSAVEVEDDGKWFIYSICGMLLATKTTTTSTTKSMMMLFIFIFLQLPFYGSESTTQRNCSK